MSSLASKLGSVTDAAARGGRLLWSAGSLALEERLAQHFPSKPRVVQFPVNDICNSRCVMCNIWKQKRDHEITAEELRTVLRNPLFSKVEFVGINGGEPTLRKDLNELARVMAKELPRLREVHIITNGIRWQDAITRIVAVRDALEARNKRLSVSVSIDGVGEVHDRHRGVTGNFAAACRVIQAMKAERIPVSIGCTLTTGNCHGADDVLQWCEEIGLDAWEFRLGVEIKRVYNQGFNLLHPLSEEQRFHLAMFFDKLAHHATVDEPHRRFYRSLVDQIAFDAPRAAGCHWRTRGVTLDTRGNLSYCSVASDTVGSALSGDGWTVYKRGLGERKRILNEDCDGCQHDLLGPAPAMEIAKAGVAAALEPFTRRFRERFAKPLRIEATPSFKAPGRPHVSQWRRVLITGWYGTETAGDKAILAEVVHFLREHARQADLAITTIDRKVSEQTARELPELAKLELIPLAEAHTRMHRFDAVLVGGGPLEDVGEMRHVHRLFVEANRLGKARVLFGCGVGPFHLAHTRAWAEGILRLTTAGFLRDRESLELATELGGPAHLGLGCDPALRFLRRWARTHQAEPRAERGFALAGLLRANTAEYVGGDDASLTDRNSATAAQLAQVIEPVVAEQRGVAALLPMHAIWVGGDDRLFARHVARAFEDPARANVERRYLPLRAILHTLRRADAAVAMRYHGHLFCMALGVPMLSIDYTGPRGKVGALVKRVGHTRWSEAWDTLDPARATSKLRSLIASRDAVTREQLRQADRLVAELEATYEQVFEVKCKAAAADAGLRAAA